MNPENVIIISNLTERQQNNYQQIKAEFLKLPGIISIGGSYHKPDGSSPSGQGFRKPDDLKGDEIVISELRVQPGFFETIGMELTKGRYFRDASEYDKNCIILNEEAVKTLGLKNPVGSKVIMNNYLTLEVIGIVKDFHYATFKDKIGPISLTNYNRSIKYISVKYAEKDFNSIRTKLDKIMKTFDPTCFVKFEILDDIIKSRHKNDYLLGKVLISGSLLATIIATLGLFALSLFIIHNGTKEIGIRKIFGGSVFDISRYFIWNIIKWIIAAAPIGITAGYYIMNKWLQNFVYKTELSWWVFALTGGIALIIALLTVSWQTWRAATRNPVEALRYE